MRRLWSLDDVLDLHDGVIAYRELLAMTESEELVRYVVRRHRLLRLRRGWYGAPSLPLDVRQSWAAGGPLACISALIHHGAMRADDPRHVPGAVHVALPRGAHPPTTLGRDIGDARIIWHYGDASLRARRAVSAETAHRQLAHCRVRPIDKAADVRRRALGREREEDERRERLLAALPRWGSS